nr:hypothetical protein [uncultured Ilyobacter sp.]
MIDFNILKAEDEDKKFCDELRFSQDFPISNNTAIFLLAACIGYRLGGERVSSKKSQDVTKVSYIMENPMYKPILDAFDVLAEHEKVPTNIYVEEYASKGFKELMSWYSNKKPKNSEVLINRIIATFAV